MKGSSLDIADDGRRDRWTKPILPVQQVITVILISELNEPILGLARVEK